MCGDYKKSKNKSLAVTTDVIEREKALQIPASINSEESFRSFLQSLDDVTFKKYASLRMLCA
jgi:hypothetical protein